MWLRCSLRHPSPLAIFCSINLSRLSTSLLPFLKHHNTISSSLTQIMFVSSLFYCGSIGPQPFPEPVYTFAWVPFPSSATSSLNIPGQNVWQPFFPACCSKHPVNSQDSLIYQEQKLLFHLEWPGAADTVGSFSSWLPTEYPVMP